MVFKSHSWITSNKRILRIQSNLILTKKQSRTIRNLKRKNWWSSKRGSSWGIAIFYMINLSPKSSTRNLRYFIAAAVSKRRIMMMKTLETEAAWANWITFCAVTLLSRTWPPGSKWISLHRWLSVRLITHKTNNRLKSLTLIKRKRVIVIMSTVVVVMRMTVIMRKQRAKNRRIKRSLYNRTRMLKNLMSIRKKRRIWENPYSRNKWLASKNHKITSNFLQLLSKVSTSRQCLTNLNQLMNLAMKMRKKKKKTIQIKICFKQSPPKCWSLKTLFLL